MSVSGNHTDHERDAHASRGITTHDRGALAIIFLLKHPIGLNRDAKVMAAAAKTYTPSSPQRFRLAVHNELTQTRILRDRVSKQKCTTINARRGQSVALRALLLEEQALNHLHDAAGAPNARSFAARINQARVSSKNAHNQLIHAFEFLIR